MRISGIWMRHPVHLSRDGMRKVSMLPMLQFVKGSELQIPSRHVHLSNK